MVIFCYVLLAITLACKGYSLANQIYSAREIQSGRPTRVARLDFACTNGLMTPVLFSPKNQLTSRELYELATKLLDENNYQVAEFKRSLEAWANDTSRINDRLQVPEPLCNLQEVYCVKASLKHEFLHPNWNQNGITVCKIKNRKQTRAHHIAWNSKEAQSLYHGQLSTSGETSNV